MLTALPWTLSQWSASQSAQQPWSTLENWWRGLTALHADKPNWAPIDVAMAAGFLSDRLAFAFASGHQTALRRLIPQLSMGNVAALCISEKGGGHPRAIATTAIPDGSGWRIDGTKTYTTLLPMARTLFVACRTDTPEAALSPEGGLRTGDGAKAPRPTIRVVRVSAPHPGVNKRPMPPTPFCPEIPHGITELNHVLVGPEAMLEGDGFARLVRPFRTVEDVHVSMALTGYLLGTGRRHGWATGACEELFAIAAALRRIDDGDPAATSQHIALAGTLGLLEQWQVAHDHLWSQVPTETRARWQRDRPVLRIAGKVREIRRQRAWPV